MIRRPVFQFTSKIFGPFASRQNVVLSPISIHMALSMVLLGSDQKTETKNELLATLGLDKIEDEQINECLQEYSALIAKFKEVNKHSQKLHGERKQLPEDNLDGGPKAPFLDIFNMVITKDQGDILPAYEAKIRKYLDSSVVRVDDKRPETKTNLLERLDKWAEEAGLSQPIMNQGELNDKFAAILLSAIRVEGFWFSDFSEQRRESPIFHNLGKRDQPVRGPLLSCTRPRDSKYLELTSADKARYKFLRAGLTESSFSGLFEELSGLNMQVAEVPLQGDLSFTIFEPLNPSGDGGELDKLVDQLMQSDETSCPNKLEKVFSLLDSELGSNPIGCISLPKFGFENNVDLKSHLESIGLRSVFSPSAQISNMTARRLYIEKISHQAMIDVNQFGIKAAGVTKIKMMLTSMARERERSPVEVHVEHPFLFVIRYGPLPLFIGRLDTVNK